ncbi:amidohydrolase family protein [Chitinophaga sp. 30R24]|uniref:amidohydrolase family protein n=1 Tax=Chitinophaga sp. 30R24 TaxID=3248838 RepID=UPI003B90887E
MFDKPIFDAHLHIIDHQFPLQPNYGYLPANFSVADYRQKIASLPIQGGAVVSGSFQGFDQAWLLAALKQLGPGYVGVTQLPASTPDDTIIALHEAGVRAIRFNVQHGGAESIRFLEQLGLRVYDLVKWHVELYVDSRQLPGLFTTLHKLPAVVVDHLGLSKAGFKYLLPLVEKGARVKATGFSRCDFDVLTAMKQISAINPGALLFGTDLPSTRAPRTFVPTDLQLILDHFPDNIAAAICRENALALYQPTVQ